jgi:hypothetical protein
MCLFLVPCLSHTLGKVAHELTMSITQYRYRMPVLRLYVLSVSPGMDMICLRIRHVRKSIRGLRRVGMFTYLGT